VYRLHRYGVGKGEWLEVGTFSFKNAYAIPSWTILRYAMVLGVEDLVVAVIGLGVVGLNALQVSEDALKGSSLIVVY
jgi:hypothetical protein